MSTNFFEKYSFSNTFAFLDGINSTNMSSTIKSVARIDNQFVYNARYNLSARESKIILFLISRIDPVRQKNLIEQTVSVKELERVLKGDAKRWGGLYAELEIMRDRLVRKGIILPTEIEVEGKRFSGYINWFQHIMLIFPMSVLPASRWHSVHQGIVAVHSKTRLLNYTFLRLVRH